MVWAVFSYSSTLLLLLHLLTCSSSRPRFWLEGWFSSRCVCGLTWYKYLYYGNSCQHCFPLLITSSLHTSFYIDNKKLNGDSSFPASPLEPSQPISRQLWSPGQQTRWDEIIIKFCLSKKTRPLHSNNSSSSNPIAGSQRTCVFCSISRSTKAVKQLCRIISTTQNHPYENQPSFVHHLLQ